MHVPSGPQRTMAQSAVGRVSLVKEALRIVSRAQRRADKTLSRSTSASLTSAATLSVKMQGPAIALFFKGMALWLWIVFSDTLVDYFPTTWDVHIVLAVNSERGEGRLSYLRARKHARLFSDSRTCIETSANSWTFGLVSSLTPLLCSKFSTWLWHNKTVKSCFLFPLFIFSACTPVQVLCPLVLTNIVLNANDKLIRSVFALQWNRTCKNVSTKWILWAVVLPPGLRAPHSERSVRRLCFVI